MNIQFNYLYRDAGNNKQFGSAVFTNTAAIPLADAQASIEKALIEGMWFDVEKWGLADLHIYPWVNSLDHTWHEFESVEETEGKATGGDIGELLGRIGSKC